MAQSTPIGGISPSALRGAFDAEAEYLIHTAQADGLAEGVLRLRALLELAALLSTEALIELAATVTVARSGIPRRRTPTPPRPAPAGRVRPVTVAGLAPPAASHPRTS